MKKLLSLLVVAALLMSAFTVTAFATSGPAEGTHPMAGSAQIGYYDPDLERIVFVLENKGGLVVHNDAVPGVTYDLSANTLTMKDVHMPDAGWLFWYVGDDFKLNIEGEVELSYINVLNYFNFYSSGLSIIGTGTLTVNEKRRSPSGAAVRVVNEGDGSTARLNIADSVTVHLYAESSEDEDPEGTVHIPVISLNYTSFTPEQGGGITVGGRPMPEAKSERIVYTECEYENAAVVTDRDELVNNGRRVIRKADPDGVYALRVWDWDDGDVYYVTRYVYVPKLDMYVADYSFGEEYSSGGIRYTQEEFEAEYDYAVEDQPETVLYTTDYWEKNRGWIGTQLVKADEPGEVYIGSGYWDDWESDNEADGYYIHHLIWDEDEQYYVDDEAFEVLEVPVSELYERGFSFKFSEYDEPSYMTVWAKPAPYDDDNYVTDKILFNRASDPDGLYVGNEYEDSYNDIYGYIIWRVHYDAEADVHYVDSYSYDDPDDCFIVTYDELTEGSSDFSMAMDHFTEKATLRYIDDSYPFEYYASQVTKMTKDGGEDVYGLETWTDGSSVTRYTALKLDWREDKGHYYYNGVISAQTESMAELEDMGYHVVISPQPADFCTYGSVYMEPFELFTDSDGNRYVSDWRDIYSIDEDNKFEFGGEVYYIGTLRGDLTEDDLISTEYEVVTDIYRYCVDAGEYHHIGSAPAGPVLGDADGDGSATVMDASLIQAREAMMPYVGTFNEKAADVDGDGAADVIDATFIRRYAASIGTPYRVGQTV